MATVLNIFSSIRLPNNMTRRTTPPPISLSLPLNTYCIILSGRRLTIRAAETDANEAKAPAQEKAPLAGGSSFNQILGIKGAKQEKDIWKIRVQLTKPVTWPPLVWGVVCGAAASGNFHWTVEDVAKSLVCMMMSGPCLTGYTQVITQIWVLLLGGLGLASILDVWAGHDFPIIFYLAIGGSLVSYIYSAPPLKPHTIAAQTEWMEWKFCFGSKLYKFAVLGIGIVNDFKSVEGDRALGLQSIPVAFGAETAKWICVGAIDITQISVASYLLGAGKPYYALTLLGLILPQVFFQFKYFLKDPVKYDVKYQASAQPFMVLGLLVTALATSH
ncbi:hypothetical protein RHMOL_Rhmol09G0126600 [Rhododendron molle]|uniref:Uncharacterized protein n=1 Tax=Rhododendron molle TaxID=49168 RepID=A0ACC0MDW7_RHOML|nr:hypothetical protein RHMOL_Rhmol09G0126600 [Rhododendron molle]